MANVIKLHKGLNINLKGKAAQEIFTVNAPDTYALVPDDFHGVTPKVVVKEQESVKAGDALFVDKNHPEVKFVSPVSGTVTAVTRGERRKVLSITVAAAKAQEYVEFGKKDRLEEFRKYYADGLGRICRYLKKHWENENIHYYLDYRRMLTAVKAATGMTGPLTEEEKFPRDLTAAHDRVMDAQNAINREIRKKGTPEQIKTFAGIKKTFAPLEWRSGEYCIVIPASPEDLIREGDVLHHCVGGYASQHCSGRMIFFVRHARRPERSWYTLNEDVNGSAVRRIQLHGYRNEMVNGKTLTIPKEVTDFVLRWEMEVLAPYLKNKGRISA